MILNHFKVGIKIAATKTKQKIPKFGKEVESFVTLFFERIINVIISLKQCKKLFKQQPSFLQNNGQI